MAKSEAGEALASAPGVSGNTIDQVRELLFGADKRSHEQRLQELDEKFERRLDTLRAEMEKRFAELEASLKAATAAGDEQRRKSVEQIGEAISSLGTLIKKQAI